MAPANPIGFRPTTGRVTSGDGEFTPTNLSRAETTTELEAPVFLERLRSSTDATRQVATIQDCGDVFLVSPLYVIVECIGGAWSAQSGDLGLIGQGETEFEALDELRSQVGELFVALREMKESLGSLLAAQLAFLERLAAPR